jgi:hypothetical protein
VHPGNNCKDGLIWCVGKLGSWAIFVLIWCVYVYNLFRDLSKCCCLLPQASLNHAVVLPLAARRSASQTHGHISCCKISATQYSPFIINGKSKACWTFANISFNHTVVLQLHCMGCVAQRLPRKLGRYSSHWCPCTPPLPRYSTLTASVWQVCRLPP